MARHSLVCLLVVASSLGIAHGFCPSVSIRPSVAQKSLPSISPRSAQTARPAAFKSTIELSGLLYDSTSTAFDAWEWTANLGAPAALVAGAVLVTLSETRADMAPRKNDENWIRVVKLVTRFLLLSSFALEVVSIFVSTVTGTVLLSHGEASKLVGYTAPLQLLHHHHEFEYLTIRIGFLQGLVHWIMAVGLEMMLPKQRESLSAKRMNSFLAACLTTLVFWILAFYNHHLTFYGNYFGMCLRHFILFKRRFITPLRPMAFLYVPSGIISAILGFRAFSTPPDLDNDDDD